MILEVTLVFLQLPVYERFGISCVILQRLSGQMVDH